MKLRSLGILLWKGKEYKIWNDAKDASLDIFNKIKEKEMLLLGRPLCGKREVHIYMHRFQDFDKGTIWDWCSA